MTPVRTVSAFAPAAPLAAPGLRALASPPPPDGFAPGVGKGALVAATLGGAVVGSAAIGFGSGWFWGPTEVLSGMFHGSVVGAALGAGLGAVVASVVAGPAGDGRMGSIGTALVGGAVGSLGGLVTGALAGAYIGTAGGNALGFAAGAVLGGGAGYLAMRLKGTRSA